MGFVGLMVVNHRLSLAREPCTPALPGVGVAGGEGVDVTGLEHFLTESLVAVGVEEGGEDGVEACEEERQDGFKVIPGLPHVELPTDLSLSMENRGLLDYRYRHDKESTRLIIPTCRDGFGTASTFDVLLWH